MSLRSKSARKKSKADEPDKKDADKEVKDTPKDTKKGASESKTEKGTAAAAEKKDASASSEKHDKGGDKASAAEHHKEEKKGEASEAKGEAKAGDGKADAKTADKNEKEKAAVGKKERSLSIKSKERKKKGSVTDVAKGGSAAATATNDKAKAEGTATATATSTESKGEAAASSSSTASTSAAASSEAKSSGREEELLEQIKEKDKKISELESKLAEAHETIKAKDQTIEDLKKQLAAKGEGAGTSAEGAAQVETVKPTVVGTPSFTSLAQQQKDEPQAQSAVIVGNSPMRKASRAGHVAESAGSPRPTGAAAAADGKKKKKKKDKGKEKDSTVTEESTTAGDLSSPEDSASTPGSTIKASEGATPTVASTDDTSAAASASSAAPAAVGGRRLPRPTSDKAVLEPDCELSHINLRKGAGLKTAFHDLNLAVNISGGGTTALGAHTSIVTARCPQFHKTIKEQQEKRKKKGKAPIQLDVRAHDVASVNYLLDFLYCDKVEFPKMSPIDVLHLIIVARAYGLNRLRWIAEDYLLQIINMKNVVELLKQSSTLGEKTVKCICLDFLLEPEHFAQFVQLKESINTLGLELFQEVVAINATKATTGPQTEDRGSCPPSTLRKDFKKLYETMEYSDSFVKLEAKNIPFHKAILAAHSKKLAKAFSEKKKENAKASDEDMTDVLKLVDLTVQTLPPGKKKAFRMSEAAFRSMLKYVYYGETEIDPLPACELVNWAHHYDMSALKKLCEQHIQNGITPGFVINIMAVTYLAIMRERADMMSLRQQCIQFAMENLASIKLERIRDMDGALDIAIDLLLACQKMVQSAS